MFGNRFLLLLCLATLLAFGLLVGCGSNDSTTNSTGGTHSGTQFTEFGTLVEAIAPPVYQGPSSSPMGEFDSIWTNGDYPLLGKVFGEDEPMSLYWNVDNLDQAIEILSAMADELADNGISTDTSLTWPGGQSTVEVRTLSAATTIPTECQPIMGMTSVDLDKVYRMTFTEGELSNAYDVGFSIADSSETYLTYFSTVGGGSDTVESFLYYAHVNPLDSAIDIRGVFFKDYGNQTSARWGYSIQRVEESDFVYRMSWYSDENDMSLLGCIVGGGNKDVEFALKYRQYQPADAQEVDSLFSLDQMFDGDYNYVGTGIATGYEDFVNEENIYTLDYMPAALITSPWAE